MGASTFSSSRHVGMGTGDSYGWREFAAAGTRRAVELPHGERIKSRYSYLRSHGYER
jgi:hypothetical protein